MHTELSPRAMVETVLEGPDELDMDRTAMDQTAMEKS